MKFTSDEPEPEFPYAIIELATSESALRFMRASEEIESMIDGASVRIFNMADYVVGQPPPPGPSGEWKMVGIITGQSVAATGKEKAEILARWTEDVVQILESYGLKAEKEPMPS